jgi:hypothetical protein
MSAHALNPDIFDMVYNTTSKNISFPFLKSLQRCMYHLGGSGGVGVCVGVSVWVGVWVSEVVLSTERYPETMTLKTSAIKMTSTVE